jgi:hypothetical protein
VWLNKPQVKADDDLPGISQAPFDLLHLDSSVCVCIVCLAGVRLPNALPDTGLPTRHGDG